jgi:mycothione reductase
MIDYDVLVVGAGSGNMLPAHLDGLRVAVIERGPFGGTCLNRGCVPSKMLVYAADVAQTVRAARRYGVDAELRAVDWPAIRDRVFGRTDESARAGFEWRKRSGVDVYTGEARFVGPKVLAVDGKELRAERMILAAGSRPSIPEVPGIDDVARHTTDTIMRVDARPASMVILGGGYIAAEMSHIFGAFGTEITIVERTAKLLSTLDDDIASRFTERCEQRFDVRVAAEVTRVEPAGRGVAVRVEDGRRSEVVQAETLLVATGRTPNSDLLDVEAGGIATHDDGRVITDDTFATNVPGVYAIGDLANETQLKHLANAQMQIAVHNVFHPDDPPRRARFPVLPAAVFADPQIATAGPSERELREQGRSFDVAIRDYADTAFGWAAEDTTGFVKLIADPETRHLISAHIIGPQAAILIQPLVQAISLGNTVEQLARDVLYIHPAPAEVVAQTLLALPAPRD